MGRGYDLERTDGYEDQCIVMGNTTFTVQGVTFEYPDPDGQSVYTIASTPITAAAQTPLRQHLGDTVAADV